MPEILKIGQTTRDTETRARELSRPTGIPADFEIIYDEVVSDVNAAEQEIHVLLSARRVNKSREFFRIGICDAIKIVQDVCKQFLVDEEAEASEIEILPQLESRIRRWIRREIVSVKFVQFPDLCLLRVTEQPDPTKIDAFQAAVDLRIFGDSDYASEDGLLFSPSRKTIRENVATFVELDP
jgi:T5orf172 domain